MLIKTSSRSLTGKKNSKSTFFICWNNLERMVTTRVTTTQYYNRDSRQFSGWLSRIQPAQRKVQTKITKKRQTEKSRITTSRLKKWKSLGTSGKWAQSKMGVLRCGSVECHSIHLNNFSWNINLHCFLYYFFIIAFVKPSHSLELT